MNIIEAQQLTKEDIALLKKPLSAYQYYIKDMRENWKSLPKSYKQQFISMAKKDKERYENEKDAIMEIERNEIKKLKIYLSKSNGRVPCVGLDNGFYRYQIEGPVTKVELFTEEEIKRLNLPESAKKPTYKAIYIYPSFFPYKYNVKAARKWGVLAYGGNKNDSESWYRIKENYEGKTGHFTTYTNYKGETWTENYKKTIYD
tara:strand:+ start:1264 stop:1869 length:606 start_codon:yes stop_codon:yes gene_type:complete